MKICLDCQEFIMLVKHSIPCIIRVILQESGASMHDKEEDNILSFLVAVELNVLFRISEKRIE
jgi:hypothetical protein